jgi:hypothetical protein
VLICPEGVHIIKVSAFGTVEHLRERPIPTTTHAVLIGFDAKPVFGPPNGGPSHPSTLGSVFDFLLGCCCGGQHFLQKLLSLGTGRHATAGLRVGCLKCGIDCYVNWRCFPGDRRNHDAFARVAHDPLFKPKGKAFPERRQIVFHWQEKPPFGIVGIAGHHEGSTRRRDKGD